MYQIFVKRRYGKIDIIFSQTAAHHAKTNNMNSSTRSDYKAWVEDLVRTCLPIRLQKKLLSLEPLTKEEATKFMDVIQLAGDVKRMSDHAQTIGRLDEIAAEVKRQGMLTRQEFRKVQRDPLSVKDKRSKAQRTFIDKAVHLYVLLHDINGSKAASFLSCCNRYWDLASGHFADIEQYKNFVNYDYNNFYDISALEDMIRRGDITV